MRSASVIANPFGTSGSKLCWDCPAMCCTHLEPPLLTAEDTVEISLVSGRQPPDFSRPTDYGSRVGLRQVLAQPSGACIFLGPNRRCTIYEHRPLDCMLYPLDLRVIEGRLHWIVYALMAEGRDCPLEKHPRLSQAIHWTERHILPRLRSDELITIATETQPSFSLYREGNWRQLREVDLAFCSPGLRHDVELELQRLKE